MRLSFLLIWYYDQNHEDVGKMKIANPQWISDLMKYTHDVFLDVGVSK